MARWSADPEDLSRIVEFFTRPVVVVVVALVGVVVVVSAIVGALF